MHPNQCDVKAKLLLSAWFDVSRDSWALWTAVVSSCILCQLISDFSDVLYRQGFGYQGNLWCFRMQVRVMGLPVQHTYYKICQNTIPVTNIILCTLNC